MKNFLLAPYNKLNCNLHKPIISDETGNLSCRKLKDVIDIYINYFDREHVVENVPIGVYLPKSTETVSLIYSIVLRGNCYVPIDLNNPENRVEYIISNLNLEYIVGKGSCPKFLKNKIKWIDIDKINCDSNYDNKSINVHKFVDGNKKFVILHSSGSTGNPKAIAISWKAVSCFVNWGINTFNVSECDVIANLAPFHFDLSLFDLFVCFCTQCCMKILPNEIVSFPKLMTSWFKKNGITIWYTIPSVADYWGRKAKENLNDLDIRLILVAGEKASVPGILNLLDKLPEIDIYNLFGPTETNVCCFWKINKDYIHKYQQIPIGYAACDLEIRVNSNNELLVKGDTVFNGYICNQILENKLEKGGWYNTGDICYKEKNTGLLIFRGRNDRMIKKSGFRIAPEEIEAVVKSSDLVDEVAVLGIKNSVDDSTSSLEVILFYTNEYNNDISFEIKKHLKTSLPAYMIPNKLINIEKMPLLSNGKINLERLKNIIHAKRG